MGEKVGSSNVGQNSSNRIAMILAMRAYQELEKRCQKFGAEPAPEVTEEVHGTVRKARITLVEYLLLSAMILDGLKPTGAADKKANHEAAVKTIKETSQSILQEGPPGKSQKVGKKHCQASKPVSSLTVDDMHPCIWHGSLRILRNQKPE